MAQEATQQQKYGPAGALAVTFAAYFGSQLVAGFLLGLFIALSGKGSDQVTRWLSDSTPGQFLFIALIEAATLGILYWFIRRRKISLADIGLGRLPKASDFGWAGIFFIGYFVLLGFILQSADQFIPKLDVNQEQQIGFDAAHGFGPLLLVFISLVILPPIVEEIMIRGFLYTGLRQKMNRIIATFVASFLFGMAHLQLGSGAPPLYVAAIDTFFLSIVLITLREKTHSLWAGMFVHAIKNGLAFLALFVFKTR